jgi:hypothetical protein
VTVRTTSITLAGYADHDENYRLRALDEVKARYNIPQNCEPVREETSFGSAYHFKWFEIVTD